MWTKHKPAITKLHDTFSRKIQQLSDKFQQKLAKKVQKWFNRSKNRRRKNKSKSKDSGEPNFAKTSRRGNEDGMSMEINNFLLLPLCFLPYENQFMIPHLDASLVHCEKSTNVGITNR